MGMTTSLHKTGLSRREQGKAARRAAILAVAERSFLEHGYQGTTMSAIAAELGGSKGTLWSYFASKEELFDAFLDKMTSSLREEMMAALAPSTEVAPGIELFVKRLLTKIVQPGALGVFRLVVGESGRSPEVGRMFYRRTMATMEGALSGYIAGHMAAGRLRATDPTSAARLLMSMIGSGYRYRVLLGVETAEESAIATEAAMIAREFVAAYAPVSAPRTERDRP